MQPAKRHARAQSFAADPTTAQNEPCACDHHCNNEKPSLPWLPKRVRFSLTGTHSDEPNNTKPIPSLLPLNVPTISGAPTSTVTSQSVTHGSTDNGEGSVDAETLRAQIRMNTQMMSAIENLRKDVDQAMKERDFFKLKLSKATDQLTYLKKKVNKNHAHDENIDPNKVDQNSDEINITKTTHTAFGEIVDRVDVGENQNNSNQ